jgi:hypothetical protein
MRASIRARLLAAFLVVAITAAAGLSFYFLKELEGFALRKLEERLHTQARMLASVASTTYLSGAGLGPPLRTRATCTATASRFAGRLRVSMARQRASPRKGASLSTSRSRSSRPERSAAPPTFPRRRSRS